MLIRALLRCLSWLPLPLMHAVGTAAGTLMYWLPTRARQVTLTNLRLCFPEMEDQQIRQLARESLQETGKSAAELGLVWASPVEKVMRKVVRVRGRELIDEHLARGRGLIIIAPHLGSWELSGLYVSTVAPITYLYRPPRMKAFEEVLVRYRDRGGAGQAPTTRRGILQLIRTLREGKVAGILPDQQPTEDNGVFAPFFHEKALTMTLVARLAARSGAPVISAVTRRLPRGAGFEVQFRNVEPGIDSEDSLTAATALNRTVENCVREMIPQYQWEYKRFRRRPPEEKGRSLY
ncbi:MAG: lysophospholipid acyltransferase family protein [Pseudomonadota bacterium]